MQQVIEAIQRILKALMAGVLRRRQGMCGAAHDPGDGCGIQLCTMRAEAKEWKPGEPWHSQHQTKRGEEVLAEWPNLTARSAQISRLTFLLPGLTDEGLALVLTVAEAAPKRDLSSGSLAEEQRLREKNCQRCSSCSYEWRGEFRPGLTCPKGCGGLVRSRLEAQGQPLAVSRAMANALAEPAVGTPEKWDDMIAATELLRSTTARWTPCARGWSASISGIDVRAIVRPHVEREARLARRVTLLEAEVADYERSVARGNDEIRALRKANVALAKPGVTIDLAKLVAGPALPRGEAMSKLWLVASTLDAPDVAKVLALAESLPGMPEVVNARASSPETGPFVEQHSGTREAAQAECDRANVPLTDSQIVAVQERGRAIVDKALEEASMVLGKAEDCPRCGANVTIAGRLLDGGRHCFVCGGDWNVARPVPGEVADVETAGDRGPAASAEVPVFQWSIADRLAQLTEPYPGGDES